MAQESRLEPTSALDALTYTLVWVGLGAVAQGALTLRVLGRPFGEWRPYLLFLFGGTLAFYAFHRLYSLWRLLPRLPTARWRKTYRLQRWLVGGVALGLALALLGFVRSPPLVHRLAWIPAGLSTLYALPLFRGRRLRDFGLVKPLWLVLGWVALVHAVPFAAAARPAAWPLLVERACFVLGIVLTFDYRDVPQDRAVGVRTWPQLLGRRASAVLVGALFVASAALASDLALASAASAGERSAAVVYLAWALTSALAVPLCLVGFRESRPPDRYYDFWLDGLVVLPALLAGLGLLFGRELG